MTGCKECYRRERRAAGLCVYNEIKGVMRIGCTEQGKLKDDGVSRYEHCEFHHKPRTRKPKYPGLAAARAQGKTGGRKPVLTLEKQSVILAAIAAGKETGIEPDWKDISQSIAVSITTTKRFIAGQYKHVV